MMKYIPFIFLGIAVLMLAISLIDSMSPKRFAKYAHISQCALLAYGISSIMAIMYYTYQIIK